MALVLDTGVIYAALDENDADHERCAALIGSAQETLIVPSPVLVELDSARHSASGKLRRSTDATLASCVPTPGARSIYCPADACIAELVCEQWRSMSVQIAEASSSR